MGDDPKQVAARMAVSARQQRRFHRRFLLSTVSHQAFRVKGALDGRVSLNVVDAVGRNAPWWWNVAKHEDGSMR